MRGKRKYRKETRNGRKRVKKQCLETKESGVQEGERIKTGREETGREREEKGVKGNGLLTKEKKRKNTETK